MISVIRNGHCSVTVQISPVKVYIPISRFCSPITMEIFIFIFCYKVFVNLTEMIKFCFSNMSKLPFCDIAVHIFPCVLIIIVNNIVLLIFILIYTKRKLSYSLTIHQSGNLFCALRNPHNAPFQNCTPHLSRALIVSNSLFPRRQPKRTTCLTVVDNH